MQRRNSPTAVFLRLTAVCVYKSSHFVGTMHAARRLPHAAMRFNGSYVFRKDFPKDEAELRAEETMDTYKARERIIIKGGIVCRSADQAVARRPYLHRIGDALYKIVADIQFKKGEVFGCDPALKGTVVR